MIKTFKIFSFLSVIAMAFAAVSPVLAQIGTHPTRGEDPLSEHIVSAIAMRAKLRRAAGRFE
jgi:hypothetical protein